MATNELIEVFPIATDHGMRLHGELYGTARSGGRRVLVRETADGPVMWDSDDCYDAANVRDKLDQWLEGL